MKRPSADQVRRALPRPARALVESLVGAADSLDCGLLLVGGPVRDLLLGRPVLDVDLAVEPPAGRSRPGARAVARAGAPEDARVRSHARFGTVSVETAEIRVDLATVRTETYVAPGALPTVAPGTLDGDLRRRDFSINAMAIPLNAAARRGRGGVVDPMDGATDLESGVLRVLHPRSFHDDPTRALRAARFAVRLGFGLSRGSRSALRAAVRDGALGAVSGERYRAELEKGVGEARAGASFAKLLATLDAWDVLAALEPGLGVRPEARAPLRFVSRTLQEGRLLGADGDAFEALLTAWLTCEERAMRRRVLERLAVRGELATRVASFARDRDGLIRRLEGARGRGATDAVLRRVPEASLVALAAGVGAPLRRRVLRHLEVDRELALPVGGDDLLELGLSGPALGTALARLRSAWIDQRIRSRGEALALARELARDSTTAASARGRVR